MSYGRPCRRCEESDLLVVVQGAHRQPGSAGEIAHSEQFLRVGHGHDRTTSRNVSCKLDPGPALERRTRGEQAGHHVGRRRRHSVR